MLLGEQFPRPRSLANGWIHRAHAMKVEKGEVVEEADWRISMCEDKRKKKRKKKRW